MTTPDPRADHYEDILNGVISSGEAANLVVDLQVEIVALKAKLSEAEAQREIDLAQMKSALLVVTDQIGHIVGLNEKSRAELAAVRAELEKYKAISNEHSNLCGNFRPKGKVAEQFDRANKAEADRERLAAELAQERHMKECQRGMVQRAHQAFHELAPKLMHEVNDDTEPAAQMRLLVTESSRREVELAGLVAVKDEAARFVSREIVILAQSYGTDPEILGPMLLKLREAIDSTPADAQAILEKRDALVRADTWECAAIDVTSCGLSDSPHKMMDRIVKWLRDNAKRAKAEGGSK